MTFDLKNTKKKQQQKLKKKIVQNKMSTVIFVPFVSQ